MRVVLKDLSLVECHADVAHGAKLVIHTAADVHQQRGRHQRGTKRAPSLAAHLVIWCEKVACGCQLDLEVLDSLRTSIDFVFNIIHDWLEVCDYYKLVLIELSIGQAEVVHIKVERGCPQCLHGPSLENRNLAILNIWVPAMMLPVNMLPR